MLETDKRFALQPLVFLDRFRAELAGIEPATPLFSAGVGLDSLAGTLLLHRIHRRYGVDVAAEDLNLDALETLGTLATFVAGHRQW